jgi:hypothetical protein
LRGNNVLRKHKLDVALYDMYFNPHIIKDVIVDGEMSDVKVDVDFPISGVLINVNDYGYAKIRFDDKTQDLFENHLNVKYSTY